MMNKQPWDENLKQSLFIVEATSCETLALWGKFCKDTMFKIPGLSIYTWEQLNPGYMIQVGEFHEFPVNISVCWHRINGVLVMFYEAISRVVDHDMVKDWLRKNCSPKAEFTDAMNFHQVLQYVREQS